MANTRMPSHLSYLTILLLLALAAATDSANNSTATDAARRARAAATVAELLSVHNAARRSVGVEPLTWSARIAGYAKAYAHSHSPRRSPLFYFGENLFVGKRRHWNATALAAQWVAEGRWYDYNSNACAAPDGAAGCVHYTQVVWRNTTQLGCARILCDSGDTMLVCEYFPPGNYGNGRPY